MSFLNSSSRIVIILALTLSAMVILAACEDEIEDTVDDADTPTEAPADEPESPDPTATPDEGDNDPESSPATDDETATPESEPAPTNTPESRNGTSPAPDHEDVEDETGASPRSVLVYLVRDEEIAASSRDIAGTPQVATGAINELLTGTTTYEDDLGFSNEVPTDTSLLGIAIQDDGTAIIDLSGEFEGGGGSFSMQMRVAQIVFTLTQFDTIDQVQLRIDGANVDAIGGEGVMVAEPLSRDDFEDLSPAILLESPTPGEVVSSPIVLEGTSNTFEANMQIEIIDSAGTVIYEDFATATSGTGERGTFEVSIDVPIETEGMGTIVMYEASARDGSRTNIVEIPVDLRR